MYGSGEVWVFKLSGRGVVQNPQKYYQAANVPGVRDGDIANLERSEKATGTETPPISGAITCQKL